MSSLIGSVIAEKYRIDTQIGEGGMGTIYLAHHLTLDTKIAVKVLHDHLTSKPDLAKRFHREAKAVSLLHHEHIIQVLDFGQTDDGTHFMVMEFIEGQPLDQIMVDVGRLDELAIIKIAIQICGALDEAHAKGVVHRDLKPENIMIQKRRTNPMFVKVVDFGIAKLLDPKTGVQRGTKLTMDGLVCGTPEYISPEQACAKALDGRSDLYSLGVLMYELLADTLPFIAGSPLEIATLHLLQKPKPLDEYDNVSISPELHELVMQLLHKEPEKRPQEAHEVAQRLREMEITLQAKMQAERSDTAMIARHITPTHSNNLTPPGHQQLTRRTPARTAIVNSTPTRMMAVDQKDHARATGISLNGLEAIRGPRKILWAMMAVAACALIALIVWWPNTDLHDNDARAETTTEKTQSEKNQVEDVAVEEKIAKPLPAVSSALPVVEAFERVVRVQDEEHRTTRRPIQIDTQTYVEPVVVKKPQQAKQTPYRTLIAQAQQAKANAQWKRVVRLLKQALKQRRSTKLYKQIGRAYMKSGDTKNACRYFRKYINAHPRGVKRESATDRIASYLGQCG